MFLKILAPLSLALVLATGCAGPAAQPLMPTPVVFPTLGVGPLDHVPTASRWNPRRVFYATTRERVRDPQRINYSNREDGSISLGMALVGFGGDDISWADLNRYSRQSEREEVVPLNISGLIEVGHIAPETSNRSPSGPMALLLDELNGAITSARDRDLLIYVHGAKVNFYNACVFAAQLDHFMGRDMTSVAFSWPTRQNVLAYGTGADVKRAYGHAGALTTLIEQLAAHSEARRVHIVAWSAGGRLVTRALNLLHDRHPGTDLRRRFRLGTVYLAAADVPGDEFLRALPGLNDAAQRIVVTASSNDGALNVAKLVMGGRTRIGTVSGPLDPVEDAVVRAADRLEVINMSQGSKARGFDIDGHRYWFDHPWASTDLILAVRSDLGPSERALQNEEHPRLWSIPADYPDRLQQVLTRPGIQIRRSGDG